MNELPTNVPAGPDDDQHVWGNGVLLKKVRGDRHTWSISVVAAGPSLEEMRAALETAEALDRELTERYGTLRSKAA